MAAPLDHLNGGNRVLGLGLGWPQNEYEADGFDFCTAARRLRSLDGVE